MNNKKASEKIKEISKRIGSFIDPVTADSLKCFFDGFKIGNISARNDLSFHDHTNAWIEVVKSRGWKVNSFGIEKELKEKGMTEVEIIQELLEIEVMTWRNLEDKYVKAS